MGIRRRVLSSLAVQLGLLGQRSFFRYFTVTFRAADFEFELTAVTS